MDQTGKLGLKTEIKKILKDEIQREKK